jgi:hypothetical protein
MGVPSKLVETAQDSPDAAEYVVALLDVLGFSERVKTHPLASLIAEYRQLLAAADSSSSISVYHLLEGIATDWVIRRVVFSDSVLLWSKADAEGTLMLLTACAQFVAQSGRIGWPVRGIVTVGECVIDEGAGLYVGDAIARAAELEKAQEWLGIGLDDRLVGHSTLGVVTEQHINFVSYGVPTKAGKPAIHAALRWQSYDARAAESVSRMMTLAPEKYRRKYEAALTFLRET